MIRRTTWILVLVFAGLVSLIWLVPWWQGRNPQVTPTAIATPSAVFEEGTVTWMTLQAPDGKVVVVEKDAEVDQWTVKQPAGLIFDPNQVESAMTALEGSNVQTTLAEQPPQEVMGLDKPAFTITLMLRDGAERVIKVGSATPTGSGYYTQIGSQPAFVIGKSSIDPILDLLTAGQPPSTPTGGTAEPEASGTLGVGGPVQVGSATPTP